MSAETDGIVRYRYRGLAVAMKQDPYTHKWHSVISALEDYAVPGQYDTPLAAEMAAEAYIDKAVARVEDD